jgi:hypothetical protein
MHNLASPAGVHAFPRASARESTMTSAPKATHIYAGRVVRISRALVSFKKHAAGKIYASAVAETPPVISSVTPRSQVTSDTVCHVSFQTMAEKVGGVEVCARSIEAKRMAVVKKMCRCMLKASCEKKYCSITCGGQNIVIAACSIF